MRRIGGFPLARWRSEAFCSSIRLKKASIFAIPALSGSKSDTETELDHKQSALMAENTDIRTVLRQEIAREGPIPFSRFMEIALYCPKIGYYERAEGQIGRAGDYFTSVSVGGLFGELLAFQFAEWLAAHADTPVQVVEAGAHEGRLACDILGWLTRERLDKIEYWIIEPSEERQKW